MTLFAEVVLALPLDRSFYYLIPDRFLDNVRVGSRVVVPFKERLLTGVVIGRRRSLSKELKLKAIHDVLDKKPLFRSEYLSFTRQLSEYYHSSWGELLQIALPASFVPKSKTRISLTEKGRQALEDSSLSSQIKDILSLLGQSSYSDTYLKRKTKSKNFSSLLARLGKKDFVHIERNVFSPVARKQQIVLSAPTQLEMDFSLDRDTFRAAEAVASKLSEREYAPCYLYGPSVKRESVYFHLIKKALALDRKVLFLVPEIGMTRVLRDKFQEKLGENAALIHSQMSDRQRERQWSRIKDGQVGVVVGTRSALFSPVQGLGLVIVDKEEDESYFQKESPSYDVRKGASLRARIDKAVFVSGSLAPNVEAFYEAKKRSNLLILKKEPLKSRVEIVDVRSEHKVISRRLKAHIQECLAKKRRVLIFCNRRGYASYVACSRCGYIQRCRDCDIAMSYHKKEDELVCHYCGYSRDRFRECPYCGSRAVEKRGIGVEAVAEEVHLSFPQARVACFDTDFMKTKSDRERILTQFRDGQIDILIGTQLLAHQQELEPALLVALLNPETILARPDYRAGQRTYHLVNQMQKFASPDSDSLCLIQTEYPDHYSIKTGAAGSYEDFYKHEIRFRRLLNYPPYTHLVEVFFYGENLRTLAKKSRDFSSDLRSRSQDVEVLGPALAAVSRLRGQYRIQMILKSKKKKYLKASLRPALDRAKVKKSVLVYY